MSIAPILILREWKSDIIRYVRQNFLVEPDEWQKDYLLSYADPSCPVKRIAASACTGPGKTSAMAWAAWWFLSVMGDDTEHPKAFAISISSDNLSDNFWAELAKWRAKSPFLTHQFEWTKTRVFLKSKPETWFLSARSWSKSANLEDLGKTLSGIHSAYVSIFIDEGGNIPVPIVKGAEQALGNCLFGRILVAGNPTSLDGVLYYCVVKARDLWHVIKITGDPDDPKRSPRIDIEWARAQIKQFGRNDPWVRSAILGEFPESSINSLLSIAEVEAAVDRALKPEAYEDQQRRLGIDVARFGLDSTIIFPRQGLKAFNFVEMRGARTNEIAARIMLAKTNWQSEMEFVDGTGGFGSGVIDSLLSAGQSPFEVNFSSKATDSKFYNKRAEMHWLKAQWIKRGGSIPNDAGLIKQLVEPTYSFKDGKIIVEDKDQIIKRLGYSPDKDDALALTFALPEMPTSLGMPQFKKVTQEYNPFYESESRYENYRAQPNKDYDPYERS